MYISHILKIRVLCLILLSSISFSNSLNLQVNIVNTGQFNVEDFKDPNLNLWNIYVTTSGPSFDYHLEVIFEFNQYKPAIWGVTKARTLNGVDVISNADFTSASGKMIAYNQNQQFIDQMSETKYLPSGTVRLIVKAYLACENFSADSNSPLEIGGDCQEPLDIYETTQTNNVVSEIVLSDPSNGSDIASSRPILKWDSPGFSTGVEIEYTVYVYRVDAGSSPNEAIENPNALYFQKTKVQMENGQSQPITVQYSPESTADKELTYGFTYVWYVTAKDVLDSGTWGTSSIWGGSEPISSPLYTFIYGAGFSSANVISPALDSEVASVRPTFQIDAAMATNKFRIMLSDAEDTDVDNPIWESDDLQTSSVVYPSGERGLVPGESYKWKLQLNPDDSESPWSNVFNFRIQDYQLIQPSSDINTLTPTFNISGPQDVASYELWIGDNEDSNVEMPIIKIEDLTTFTTTLSASIDPGLSIGGSYYWKVVFLDGNGDIAGTSEDYNKVKSFRVKGVNLLAPSANQSNISLNPQFMWEGPIGTSKYKIEISKNSNFSDIIFDQEIQGTFLQYPSNEEPLENNKTYYWRVRGFDLNDNLCDNLVISYSFSTEPAAANMFGDGDAENSGDSEDTTSNFDEEDEEESSDDSEDTTSNFDEEDEEESSDDSEDVTSNFDEEDIDSDDDDGCVSCSLFGGTADCIDQFGAGWQCVSQGFGAGRCCEFVESESSGSSDSSESTEPSVPDESSDDSEEVEAVPTPSGATSGSGSGDSSDAGTQTTDTSSTTSSDEDSSDSDSSSSESTSASDSDDEEASEEDEEETLIKPQFQLLNGPENNPKNIIVKFLNEISDANQMLINFSQNAEMSSMILEEYVDANQSQYVFNGVDLDWGMRVFVQVFAINQGEVLGEASSIQVIILPDKPGHDDQVSFTMSLPSGTRQPVFEVTNFVTNASEYSIEVSSNVEMSQIIYSNMISKNMFPFTYPEQLEFGNTYFVRISASDSDGLYGIPSSVGSIFIPNIAPPALKSRFSWDATVPASQSYQIQISTTDDFTSIVLDESIESTSFQFAIENLAPGTIHYWRVRGVDSNGSPFGQYSAISYFETEGQQVGIEEVEEGDIVQNQIVTLESPGSGEELTTLTPTFKWDAIEDAEKYEIRVSKNEDYSEIIWSSANISQSSVKYPSSGTQALIAQVVYYWSVRAIANNTALGDYSTSFTFMLSEDNTPKELRPNSEESETILPFFTWKKIPRANSYGLILSKSEDVSQILYQKNNISQRQFEYSSDLPPLGYNMQYYWKVVAYDENGAPLGDFSAIASFTTPSGIIEIEFIYD